MNALPKVVLSRSIATPGWNAEAVDAPLETAIERLRLGPREVIAVGGVTLAANLLAADLVDEYRPLLLPSLLGGGHSLYKAAHPRIELKLRAHRAMDTGAVLLEYTR